MIATVDLVKVDDFACSRYVNVVVLFRRQPEDGEVSIGKRVEPMRTIGAEEFLKIEELLLDKYRRGFTQRADDRARIRRTNSARRIIRHGPVTPEFYLPFEHLL